MRKFKFLTNNKKKQRGVALIFALGILGLMVVLALTFASLSFTDQTIARSSAEQEAAKNMAKAAVIRAIAVLENNNTLSDPKKIISGDDPNNTKHYDFLWKLITHHGDVPGAGEMKKEIEDRIKPGTDSPYWQYVVVPNKDGKNEVVGRFAYIAYQPVGLLDPYLSAKTTTEHTTPITRYGIAPDEIDLTPLIGVEITGGTEASLTSGDIEALGTYNANNANPSISTPAALFERFTSDTRNKLVSSLNYVPLRNRLTSSWFSVPRHPAYADRFLLEDKYYHQFNLTRDVDKWSADVDKESAVTVSKLTAKIEGGKTPLVIFDESAAKDENLGVSIPWFKKNDNDARQAAANFLAYFSPIPKDLTSQEFWSSADANAEYTANMRTPYINELLLNIKLIMNLSGPEKPKEPSETQKWKYTLTITPQIDAYVELADLYNSMENLQSLSFEIDALDILNVKGDYTIPKEVVYDDENKEMASETVNPSLRKISFTINKENVVNNESSTKNVFPVYKKTVGDKVDPTTSFTATFTVNMTCQYNTSTNSYGDPKCKPFTVSEPLASFKMQQIKVLMKAKFTDGTEIPIDLAKVTTNAKTELKLPVLGEGEITDWTPFEFTVNENGSVDGATSQTREVIMRYRAIDSAANLKPEYWVKSPHVYGNTGITITKLTHDLSGLNNFAELKAEGLLTFDDENDKLEYYTLTAKINGVDKTFLVDKEEEPANKESLTGYGAVLSTSYIRGNITGTTAIESPWEVGFIHRGAPYQTLNIKRFNTKSSVFGKYEDGDANIFDYLKIAQKESGSVPELNKFHSRGLVNLQKISRQGETGNDAGNLPAARAFFSNFDLGWKMDAANNKITTTSGTVTDAQTIVNAIADVVDKKEFTLPSRAAILDPNHKLQSVLVKGDNDAAKEELIGRFIMLTTADSSKESQFTDFLIVTAIAQRIQITPTLFLDKDISNDSVKIESGYAYRTWNGLWEFNTMPSSLENPSNVTGDSRLLKFYPGYDKILSSQKVVAWIRKNSNGKWYIERLDYVD